MTTSQILPVDRGQVDLRLVLSIPPEQKVLKQSCEAAQHHLSQNARGERPAP